MSVETDFTEFTEFDTSHGFLLLLALLSYRLLFHTDRNLNFFSLVLCVACAYSGTQIGAMLLGFAPKPIHLPHTARTGNFFEVLCNTSTVVARRIKDVGVSVLEQVCMSGILDSIDPFWRVSCSKGIDWLRGSVNGGDEATGS